MSGVTTHAEVLKCIHQVTVDADSETNAYTTFMQDYFSSMDGYIKCLHSDLDILEGMFWYFNYAAGFAIPKIAEDKAELLLTIWEGLNAANWAEFLGQHHYEREYSLTFLSLDPFANNNTAVAAYPLSAQHHTVTNGPKVSTNTINNDGNSQH